MPLAEARLLEGLAFNLAVGPVEHPRRTVLLDAVALDVAQVPGRHLRAVAREVLDVRLDDDAPRAALGRKARRGAGNLTAPRPPRTSPAMAQADQAPDDRCAGGDAVAGTHALAHPGA